VAGCGKHHSRRRLVVPEGLTAVLQWAEEKHEGHNARRLAGVYRQLKSEFRELSGSERTEGAQNRMSELRVAISDVTRVLTDLYQIAPSMERLLALEERFKRLQREGRTLLDRYEQKEPERASGSTIEPAKHGVHTKDGTCWCGETHPRSE
jgi:hypothetical protein